MNDRIEEIRERLGKATPGPWGTKYVVNNDEDWEYTEIVHDYTTRNGDVWPNQVLACVDLNEHDGDFIANAPADVAFLLAEVERLEREKAEAWDEGHRVGMSGWLESVNPYREEDA